MRSNTFTDVLMASNSGCHKIFSVGTNKTECIVFGPSNLHSSVVSGFDAMAPHFNHVVKNQGLTLDSSLKFGKQIDSVVKPSLFQLQLLAKVKPFLSHSDLEKATACF